jgi:N-dimethylarginine dimethylaminohydrolase
MTISRTAHPRHYAMTPPTFFAVEYAINPWMDTSTTVDTHVAMNQWEALRQTYKELGHTVELVEPVAGLPDMVYAANGGLLVNGKAVVARFAYPQREGESAAYAEWMARHGFHPTETRHINEGQGDLLVVGSVVLAGYGFRTERHAHAEVAAAVGKPVVSLELVDPRFYHLDTCFCPLSNGEVMYYPAAFDAESQERIESGYPQSKRICVSEPDALRFACNAVNIGKTILLNQISEELAAQLISFGYQVIQVDLTEFLKAGGAAKCLVLRLSEMDATHRA